MKYSSFLGGTGFDEAKKLLLLGNGQVALAGYTLSDDYVVTQNAFQPALGSLDGDATLTLLDMNIAGPGALIYSTFLGGDSGDVAYDLRRDGKGRFYIAGYTLSQNFPTTNGALNMVADPLSGYNGFLAVLDPAALPNAALVYSSYVTGPGSQIAYGVELVDDIAYVIGFTTGNIFPPGAAVHNTGDANFDPFIMGIRVDTPVTSRPLSRLRRM